MTVQRPEPRAPEAVQREHELTRALEAARALQARLELLGDCADDVRWIRRLRDDLAQEIGYTIHGFLEEAAGRCDGRHTVPGALAQAPKGDHP